MTQQGAALQNYNNELVKCIEELCQKREELCRQIQQEEDEKQRLQNEILESSQTLLSVLKREAGNLTKATASDQKSSGGKDS
ncbi:microtubule nucleation factor SSNA1 isoform X1 [Rattus norvegicus]|uniref:microtubule nucleation factor SSNA1 isoform X1 n=1 Tax=Rattus norvegicus TaxID=10116 RepID=UPI00191754BD|nr:microtubule nucleation factor SSNA1 isoform X1 [Rattus norvegicus]